MIIAIDGPAASGKGTLAKKLATHFHLPHLDTGLLYRATARAVMDAGLPLQNEDAAAKAARALSVPALDESRLRGADMGEAASVVAAFTSVRQALLDLQRAFAHQPGGAVLDGRDIGTVIAPDADIKIFVTASPEVRAERRHKEAVARGETVDYGTILADIKKRDARDAGRTDAPLLAATDAHVLDTSTMDRNAAFEAAKQIALGNRR